MGGLSLGTAMVMTAVALYSTHPDRSMTHLRNQVDVDKIWLVLGTSVLVGNIVYSSAPDYANYMAFMEHRVEVLSR
jgi:hypothetical protein